MSRSRIDFNALPTRARLLLAEGSSEVGLLEAIVAELRIERTVVFDVKGERQLGTVLKALSLEAESRELLSCLGIVFDANADCGAKLTSIAAILRSNGFDFDEAQVDQYGIYAGPRLPIGIFVSPGQGRSGRIEHMILEEVASSSVGECIDQLAMCVGRSVGRALDEKGRVQAYLASFNAAHGVAVAFEKRILNIRHQAYADAREMVRQLTK